MLNNLLQMHLMLLPKKQFKKMLVQLDEKCSPQNNSEAATNEEKNIGHDREIHREKYTSLEKRQQIINDLRLI